MYEQAGATTDFDARYGATKLPNSTIPLACSQPDTGRPLAVSALLPVLIVAPLTLKLSVKVPQGD